MTSSGAVWLDTAGMAEARGISRQSVSSALHRAHKRLDGLPPGGWPPRGIPRPDRYAQGRGPLWNPARVEVAAWVAAGPGTYREWAP